MAGQGRDNGGATWRCAQHRFAGARAHIRAVKAIVRSSGQPLLAQDRDEDRDREAEQLARECQQMAPESQLEAQIRWREIVAVVQSRCGEADSAVRLAREAVDKARRSEQLDSRALAAYDLAEVLGRAGQRDEAVEAARTAVDQWREKGNLVSAHKAQRLLDDLGKGPGQALKRPRA